MKISNNFFVIILIGGKGTRYSKINEEPKQLIKINKKSLLENLIISFVNNGIKNFVFPLGYKKDYFKKFFDKKKTILNRKIKVFNNKLKKIDRQNINILLFDAGKKSSKLLRIKKSIKFFNSEEFIVTYGDGIADINFKKYIKIYEKNHKAIITSKYINSQYGHLKLSKSKIMKFQEKPIMTDPINIGYYFFTKKLFNKYYNARHELEDRFIKKLITNNHIINHVHKGFFFNIDRKEDLEIIKKKYKKLLFKL